MAELKNHLRAIPTRYLALLIVALFFPAHFIHLGLAAFNGDEGIRSLVALEMQLSGNYIAPTMHGAPYINKPPLFNWLLLVFFKLFGYFGEFPARTATVFFLAIYGWAVFRFTRKEFGREFAVLAAFMTVTSGRFLIYDSMLGLIDTTYSALIYTLFMSISAFGVRGQWLRLFLVSYLLMALGFLLKGMPSIVFQGLSLTAGLIWFGQWRRLFSVQHLAGIAVAAAVLGAYLLVYAQYRPLDVLLPNLLNESTKRTAVVFGFWRTVGHLFQFPFDSIYHFLPFSLLILAWLDRRLLQRLRQNRFIAFQMLMIAVNLPVYWSSVQVYARYLLMFTPLFTVVGFYLMEQDRAVRSWRYRVFYGALGVLLTVLPLTFFAFRWVKAVNFLPGILPLSLSFGLALAVPAFFYFLDPKRYLWWCVVALLVARIAFDCIVLPARHFQNDTSNARQAVYDLVKKYPDRAWYVYGDSYMRECNSFYMTQQLGYIVPRTRNLNNRNALYLVNPNEEPLQSLAFQGPPSDTLHTDYREVNILVYLLH